MIGNNKEQSMITIVGKADGPDRWYRSEHQEYVQRPDIGDIVLVSDVLGEVVYRVGGGYGYRPMHLYWIEQVAVNDAVIDTDYRNTVDDLARPCDG
jgi:hypothetical protein